MSLCERCIDPGFCCRNIILNQGPPVGATKLEALVWAASVTPAEGELGIPFLPQRTVRNPFPPPHRTCPLEEWGWSCPVLQEDGRCGDYENRPKLCRSFKAGYEQPCAMYGKQAAPCDLLLKYNPDPDIKSKI